MHFIIGTDNLPQQEHDLSTVAKLLGAMPSGQYDRLLWEICEIAPDSFTAMRYKMTQTCRTADKMHSSIQGILAEKLSPCAFAGAERLFQNPKQITFEHLDTKKTAVFLKLSDTDSANYKLANLFYTQALHSLCRIADGTKSHHLDIPIHFYLDDLASNVCIPDFDRIISIIRSREISVSLIIQSLSQLEALCGLARSLTILNNCDNMLYLGGQNVKTAKFISQKANKPTSTILQMPLNSAWRFTRGTGPKQVKKFHLEDHPLYRELLECQTAWRVSVCYHQDHNKTNTAMQKRERKNEQKYGIL